MRSNQVLSNVMKDAVCAAPGASTLPRTRGEITSIGDFASQLSNAISPKMSSSTRSVSTKSSDTADRSEAEAATGGVAEQGTLKQADKTEKTEEGTLSGCMTDDWSQIQDQDEETPTGVWAILANNILTRVNETVNSPENIEHAYETVSRNLALGSTLCGVAGFQSVAEQLGITPEELYKISSELFAKAKANMMANPEKYPALELGGGASITFTAATDGSTNGSAVASNDAELTALGDAAMLLQGDNDISGSSQGSNTNQTGNNLDQAGGLLAPFSPDMTLELPISSEDAANGAQMSREVEQDIVNNMLDSIQSAVTAQKSVLRVQLKPEVLGGIEIELTMTAEGINAQLRTNNQQVQTLLNTELTQLMASLRERGVQINSLDVVYSQLASGDMMFQSGDGRSDGEWANEDRSAAQAASRATRRAAEALDIEYATGAYDDLSDFYDEDEQTVGVVYDA